ncbi:hypothetical protein RJ641_001934 [Dillenia turbinata]|uniref:Uncharacterized protein n=1 Tax=Dillenia turbinata TaxID=194707 RepID=A0AAN8ZF01_9MAGN
MKLRNENESTVTLRRNLNENSNIHQNPSPCPITRKSSPKNVKIRLKTFGSVLSKPTASGGMTTPLLKWKFNDDVSHGTTQGNAALPSARKLGSALWQLRLVDVSAAADDTRLGFKSGSKNRRKSFAWSVNGDQSIHETRELRNGARHSIESSLFHSKFAMEAATKWDPGSRKTTNEIVHFCSRFGLLEKEQYATVSVASDLRADLMQAQMHILELQVEHQSHKQKLQQLLRKLGEERIAWQRKEHRKIQAVVVHLKEQLHRERKSCERMEIDNSKLVNELASVRFSSKQLMQKYEEERKARELIEQVCNELAKEIGEDKAQIDSLKRESWKLHAEVEEERKMLQIAEVWREERVQMKLVDAKLALENKFFQLNKLIKDLEAFLRSRSGTLNVMDMKEAEVILQDTTMVKIQEIEEICAEPPGSNDAMSALDNIDYGKGKEQAYTMSPQVGGFNINEKQSIVSFDSISWVEEASGLESVSHAPVETNLSRKKNTISQESNITSSGVEYAETSEVCSMSAKQPKKRTSFVSKLWRTNPGNLDSHKATTVDDNGRVSDVTSLDLDVCTSSQGKVSLSGEGEVRNPDPVGQCGSSDLGNPHIARGMKGCIEWPRGIQKSSLKAKLLEARVESQKTELH